MNDGNTFVKVPQPWLQCKDGNTNLLNVYGDVAYGFYVYCLVYQLSFEKGSIVSLSHFLDMFGFGNNRTTKSRKKTELISAILDMQKDGLITFYTDFTFADVVVIDDKVDINMMQHCIINTDIDNNFTILFKHEIAKILSMEGSQLSLIVHFSTVMSYINNKTQLAFPSLETVATLTNTAEKTCIKYNEILQESELLYYACAGLT